MDCSACCSNIIIESEDYVNCSLNNCCKKYHMLCIGEKCLTLEARNSWICPECRCASKRGGDNSGTPVGASKKTRDPYVSTRHKADPMPHTVGNDVNATSTAALVKEMCKMRNELTSMRAQFSEEIACYDTKLGRSILTIERYELKLCEAMSTIASHETKLDKYAGQIEKLIGVLSRHEDHSVSTLQAITDHPVSMSMTEVNRPACLPRQVAAEVTEQLSSSTINAIEAKEYFSPVTYSTAPPVAPKRWRRARAQKPSPPAQTPTLPGTTTGTEPPARASPSHDYQSNNSTMTAVTGTHVDEDGWERVEKRRRGGQRRRAVIKGSGASDVELKTVERTRKLHACFFAPETTAETIQSYMRRKKPCDHYHVEKLRLTHSFYASFSITVPNSNFQFFMSAENWPTSTQVSEWFRGGGGRARHAPRRHSAVTATTRGTAAYASADRSSAVASRESSAAE